MLASPPHHGLQAPLVPSPNPFPLVSTPSFSLSATTPSAAIQSIEALEELDNTVLVDPITATPTGPTERRDFEQVLGTEQSLLCSLSATSEGAYIDELSKNQTSMRAAKSKATIGILSTLIGYVSLNSLYKSWNPDAFVWQDEDREEARWLATSRSWFDRKACRWLGLCGAAHFRTIGRRFGKHVENGAQNILEPDQDDNTWQHAWTEGKESPEDWSEDQRRLREIPGYIMEYAPLVYLYSEEQFWPCDIAEHLYHITPKLNYTPIQPQWDHPSLENLDALNQWERGRNVFLTSNDNPEERPGWLEGQKNIPAIPPSEDPDEKGEPWAEWDGRVDGDLTDDQESWQDVGEDSTRGQGGHRHLPDDPYAQIPSETPEGEDFISDDDTRTSVDGGDLKRQSSNPKISKRLVGGRSGAPAVLIAVDKGHGIVDAFWFFFYSFNLGNVVFNVRFGNHVGDWEHCMIRFQHGVPKAIFFSEHSFGDAYSFDAVEKLGKRPVLYSAEGSHAMYATPGTHAYILPWGLLHDMTDRGPLWDPSLNVHSYTYDYLKDDLRSSNMTPKAPTEWFYFNGHWGDKFYPLNDNRQYRFAGQYHYVNGPLGPRFKNLGRRKVCGGPAKEHCTIRNWIYESRRPRRWQGSGKGEELSENELEEFFPNTTYAENEMI